ncbi:uncharacterized protein FIBRA_00555 [Fibroporia radiculosa]|uniref:BTB domain-containing protein n=1 Tax=Fibroporia radiculosa TaxID=599839 RepID=J4GI23_9APHY|nr:uncharacterized protein FIBRA_00555 [Fibroporia radiculosa]CCL98555.1 predicted protein [Fibroporia radiculosa]
MASITTFKTASGKEYTRSDFWFADGNIVLVVRHAIFKVHRGQLERHSDIFRDLFSIPQPEEQDMIDGCPWIELHDTPSDVLYLLTALYDGLYFAKSNALTFPALAGVLRLSNKYLIDHLRRRCLIRLRTDWPATLAGWDVREKQATDPAGRYIPRDSFPHPILVIQLAQELNLSDLIPAALYDLSRYGPRKIVAGAVPPTSLLPAVFADPSEAKSEEENGRVVLPRQELYTVLSGRESGQRYLATFVEKELSARPVSANCANKANENGRVCRESFYFIMLNVMRSVGGIASGRDADPLFTLVQAVDMLSRTDFSDGVKQCGLKICASCKADFTQTASKAREDVWEQIPVWFGLKNSVTMVSKSL